MWTTPYPRTSERQRGFTLVELMTVISIVAILAAVAAPSFRQLIATQRIRSAASALVESLWFARAEALKRNGNVDVGFLFVDAASGWTINDPGDATKPLLVQSAYPTITSVTEGGGSVQFSFNAYGRLSAGSGGIQLGDVQAGVYRCVTVASTGRATTTNGKCPWAP